MLWRKSVYWRIFQEKRGLSKFLPGGGTHALSFPSRENSGKFPGNNLRADGKKIK